MCVQSLGWQDTLEKDTATHSSVLARRVPWTEKPGGLQSMGSHRVRLDLATKQQQLDLLQYCWFFTLYILFFWPSGIWDLSSPTRD